MAKLTDAMKEIVNNQLGWIATVREDGTPNIGPKRSCRIYDDETLIFNENTAGEIMKNVKRGSKMAIGFVNFEKLDGYRFVGTPELHTEGKYFEAATEWAQGKMGAPKAAIILHIEEIYTLKSGPTAGTKLA